MDRLYTPWRLAYVTQAEAGTPDCIFCEALSRLDTAPLVVHKGRRAYVILNKFPYNNGHVMIVPHRHAAQLAELDTDEVSEIMQLAQLVEQALTEVYRPHGFNMGLNLGTSAGAGIRDHLHLHVVPRWSGDTNFMTVFGDTRVLPEQLGATAARLKTAFARLVDGRAAEGGPRTAE